MCDTFLTTVLMSLWIQNILQKVKNYSNIQAEADNQKTGINNEKYSETHIKIHNYYCISSSLGYLIDIISFHPCHVRFYWYPDRTFLRFCFLIYFYNDMVRITARMKMIIPFLWAATFLNNRSIWTVSYTFLSFHAWFFYSKHHPESSDFQEIIPDTYCAVIFLLAPGCTKIL